nr:MAG TPA: hypothetical protein [Caudoviricetes sp.]
MSWNRTVAEKTAEAEQGTTQSGFSLISFLSTILY